LSETVVAIDARLAGGTSTGDSTYWTGLLHGLRNAEGTRFLLFSNAPRPPGIPERPFFHWIHLPGTGRWWSLVRFPLRARAMGAGAIHTQYTLSPLVGRHGLTTIHDVSFLIGPEWFRPRDRLLLSRTVPASARRAARVLTVSETSREEIERLIPAAAGKTVVTPNACPPWIEPVPREEARARVERELGLAGPFALTVGTRWPRKNVDLAVSAVEGLPESRSLTLALTGKAGWGSAESGRRTRAVGYVENDLLCALYSAAELYLAPSRHEGFGIPLLEAFRCGCPVVCSRGGAMPEVAGDAARIVDSWEPIDWSHAIEELLSDSSKLDELRRRGRERERTFTWEATAQRTLEAYRGVMK
jgi:glycosyltransferase involved in cell wall biosynthesis